MEHQQHSITNTEPPPAAAAWIFDVFLSFSGEDTGKSFTDHLCAALDHKGIVTFRYDQALERGKHIPQQVHKSIRESRFYIVVFSTNYASSTRCLDELVEIIGCMKSTEQIVFPVFYDVSPADVRWQIGCFKKAFDQHELGFKDKVESWRTAMKVAASFSGWDLYNKHESKVIQEIAKAISSQLSHKISGAPKDLVGIDSYVEEIINLYLDMEVDDVRIIGICGEKGIGKTTIAQVVYDRVSGQFDGSSFLANVKEVPEKQGLIALQEQLISEVLMERNLKIWSVHRGVTAISTRLRHRKILLVLDGIDSLEQLKNLAGSRDWFGAGSRIIITCRDENLLIRYGVDRMFTAAELNHEEAMQLFCWKAFKQGHPPEDYVHLCDQVLNHARGLPLELETLGSFLFGRSIPEWKSAVNRLAQVPCTWNYLK